MTFNFIDISRLKNKAFLKVSDRASLNCFIKASIFCQTLFDFHEVSLEYKYSIYTYILIYIQNKAVNGHLFNFYRSQSPSAPCLTTSNPSES